MKFDETSALSTVVYSLVGLGGLSIQRRWHGDLAAARLDYRAQQVRALLPPQAGECVP